MMVEANWCFLIDPHLVGFCFAETRTSWKRKSLLIFLKPSESSTTSPSFTISRLYPPLNTLKAWGSWVLAMKADMA